MLSFRLELSYWDVLGFCIGSEVLGFTSDECTRLQYWICTERDGVEFQYLEECTEF